MEAEGQPLSRTWSPVVPVPSETVAVAMFQWKRLPLSRGVIFRFLAVGIAIVLLCAGAAYAVSASGTKIYGARSEIDYPLDAQIASGGFLRSDRVLQTQLVTLKSHAILDPVARTYKMSFDELAKEVAVSIPQDGEVIRVQVDDPSARRAGELVGAVVIQYLKNAGPTEGTRQQQYLTSQLSVVDNQREALTRQLAGLTAERIASAAPNTPSAAEQAAQAQLQSLLAQHNDISDKLDTATLGQLGSQKIQQLTQPYPLGGPVAPKPLKTAIAGALAGIMLAALVVTLLLRRVLKRLPFDHLD